MNIDILKKFIEVFGEEVDKRFDLLKEFKRLESYKEVR